MCTRPFYAATTKTELVDTLQQLTMPLEKPDLCRLELESYPLDPRSLQVLIDGALVASGSDTWAFSNGAVTFQGALCTRMKDSTPAAPVQVEVRSLQTP